MKQYYQNKAYSKYTHTSDHDQMSSKNLHIYPQNYMFHLYAYQQEVQKSQNRLNHFHFGLYNHSNH